MYKRQISYTTGLKYAIEGIAKLDMFIMRIPSSANPRSTSMDSILLFTYLNLTTTPKTKNPIKMTSVLPVD